MYFMCSTLRNVSSLVRNGGGISMQCSVCTPTQLDLSVMVNIFLFQSLYSTVV